MGAWGWEYILLIVRITAGPGGGVTWGLEGTDGVHTRVLAVQVCECMAVLERPGGVMQQMQSCHGTNMCG